MFFHRGCNFAFRKTIRAGADHRGFKAEFHTSVSVNLFLTAAYP